MKTKLLIGITLSLLCIGQTLLSAPLEVRSVYFDPVDGGVSVVMKVPEGTKLKVADLRLLEDDALTAAAAKVGLLYDSPWKNYWVLCIDTSGSVAGKPLRETKRALKAVLSQKLFRAKDRIALISFENKSRIIHFFDLSTKILEKVDALAWLRGNKSVLYQALYDSLDLLEKLQPAPPEQRQILVISDGKDEGSRKKSLKDVREKAIDLGIAIHVVASVHKNRVEEDLREEFVRDFKALAVETGGIFEHAEPGGGHDALARVLQKAMATPVVYFERKIDNTGPKTKTVGVQLQLPDGSSVRHSIPMGMPSTKRRSSKVFVLLLLLVALLVMVSIIVISRRAHREIKEPEKQAPYKEPSQVDLPGPEHESLRMTQVGDYDTPVSGARTPIAVLVGVSGILEGQEIPVDKEIFYVGASDECDLSMPEDDYVSSVHAVLHFEGGRLLIFDKGSQNGTFVNEEQIKDTGVALNAGDRVRFGMSIFDIAEAPR
ncbi:MAG: FHA domain-containing protein [Desulfobacteraceae bacterium]|nr:FHA domain-containing protein [Desulfobacteraceae bacterium]